MRRCEVLGLRPEDLRVAERRVFIADGKGGRQRLIPVSAWFFTAVADYLDTERPARIATVMDRLGFSEVVASEHDILDGIAWSLL